MVNSVFVALRLVENPKVREAINTSNEINEVLCKRLHNLEDKIKKDC